MSQLRGMQSRQGCGVMMRAVASGCGAMSVAGINIHAMVPKVINRTVAVRQGRKEKRVAVAICFYICDSHFTVGAEGVYYSMPSPAGKGDRKAVDEENILR